MQKWEYYTAILEKSELAKEWQDEVNSKGADGWEMVSVAVIENKFYIFFKKPVPEEKSESTVTSSRHRLR